MMVKNVSTGDFPDLEAEEKSTEHENRFLSKAKTAKLMPESPKASVTAQNPVNDEENEGSGDLQQIQ